MAVIPAFPSWNTTPTGIVAPCLRNEARQLDKSGVEEGLDRLADCFIWELQSQVVFGTPYAQAMGLEPWTHTRFKWDMKLKADRVYE